MTRLRWGRILGVAALGWLVCTGSCPRLPEPPAPASACEPDSARLAELTYQGVQALARQRGRCLLVCYAEYRRKICPR